MTGNEELALRTPGQEAWARCLREHAEQRRLAPPGECPLCDNVHRNAERERVKKEAVVNTQEAML